MKTASKFVAAAVSSIGFLATTAGIAVVLGVSFSVIKTVALDGVVTLGFACLLGFWGFMFMKTGIFTSKPTEEKNTGRETW